MIIHKLNSKNVYMVIWFHLKFILLAVILSSLFYFCEIFAINETAEKLSFNGFLQIQNGYNNSFISDWNFSNIINITNNKLDSVYAQIAAIDNNVYLVWQESVDDNSDENNYDIYFKKSLDNGSTFSKSINLSNNIGFSEHPQIAVSKNGIFIVWADNTNSNNINILFSRSLDNGTTFSEPINLSNNSKNSNNQEISASDENVYVVWQETDPTSSNNNKKTLSSIMFKSSSDSGKTFNNTKEIINNTRDAYPKINSYFDYVYVVWNNENNDGGLDDFKNNGLFFTRSYDNGNSFENINKIAHNNFGEAQIAVSKNEIFVVWGGLHSKNINGIFFVKSDDNGTTFTDPYTILENVTKFKGQNYSNKINHPTNVETISNSHSNIVWQDVISKENQDIFITNIKNNFQATKILNLSNNIGISECPQIAASENYIYVVWEDFTPGNHEIFFTKGTGKQNK